MARKNSLAERARGAVGDGVEHRLHALQPRHVGVEADHAVRRAALVAQRDAAREHVAHAAVLVDEAHLVLEARRRCRRGGARAPPRAPRGRRRARARARPRGRRRSRPASKPSMLFQRGENCIVSEPEVALPQAVLAAAQREQIALLGRAQLGLGAAARARRSPPRQLGCESASAAPKARAGRRARARSACACRRSRPQAARRRRRARPTIGRERPAAATARPASREAEQRARRSSAEEHS